MHKSAILRGLCLALLAATASQAQTVAAGARAVVSSDTLPVYASMSEAAEVKATLAKGDTVVIGLVLFGDNITWCALSRVGQARRLGFASCEFLEPDRGQATALEPAAKSKPKPVPVREVASAPITVQEVPPATPPDTVDVPALKPTAPPTTVRDADPAPPPVPVPESAAVREPEPTPPATAPVPIPEPVGAREPEPSAAPTASIPVPEPAAGRGPEPTPPPTAPVPVPEPTAVREPEPTPPSTAPVPVSEPVAVREPEPATAAQSDFIEFLLDGSGLRSSIANYTRGTSLLAFLDKGRLAEIELPTLQGSLSRWFQPAAFYEAIGGQARKNYSPERLPEVLEWLRSPVTTKLAALERRAFSPEARDELVAYADGLTAAPPSQPRLVLIYRIYDSLRTCDMEVETTLALVHTVAQAMSPALPKEKRYTSEDLDRALGAVKSRYRSIMKNARIVHYLFAFQPIPDEELEQYAGFLESENGKWLISLVDKGFFDATASISRGLRTDIPRNVQPKRRLPGENTAKGLLP